MSRTDGANRRAAFSVHFFNSDVAVLPGGNFGTTGNSSGLVILVLTEFSFLSWSAEW
jgi:hypothetical protein